MIDLLAIVVAPAVLFTGALWAADQLAQALRRWLRDRHRALVEITEAEAQAMARPHSGVVQHLGAHAPPGAPEFNPDPAD
jgi:uncharacterized membrane protein YccC